MVAFDFPGEKYLLEELPRYDNERKMLVVKFVLTFIFWTMFVPLFLASENHAAAGDKSGSENASDGTPTETIASTTTTTKSSSTTRTRATTTTTTTIVQQQRTKKKTNANKKKQDSSTKENELRKDKEHDSCSARVVTIGDSKSGSTVKVIDGYTNLFCCVGFIIHTIYVLLKSSPDNYYTSRTVFETPLFSQSECDHLVGMAERVAGENYDMAQKFVTTEANTSTQNTMMGYLKEPYGWQKTRHAFHPTTDLNLVTDNFSDDDRAWIQQRLDARLAPTLERIFGVPPSAIRANDIFLVRYDGDRQASLSRHTDNGSITFQTLLSQGFEGGGTRYWNRAALDDNDNPGTPFTYVLPKAGMMTTFPGMIEHEGVQTTKGRRYLLIGFLAVDKIDPWTHRSTDLTWFSSWGSINWASTKFKEGTKSLSMKKDSNQARQIFEIVHKLLVDVCDLMFSHRFAVLVNETSADDYLRDLDEAYELKAQSSPSPLVNYRRSSWFAGQQISVNIDGSFSRNWKTRQDADKKFDSLKQIDVGN